MFFRKDASCKSFMLFSALLCYLPKDRHRHTSLQSHSRWNAHDLCANMASEPSALAHSKRVAGFLLDFGLWTSMELS